MRMQSRINSFCFVLYWREDDTCFLLEKTKAKNENDSHFMKETRGVNEFEKLSQIRQ